MYCYPLKLDFNVRVKIIPFRKLRALSTSLHNPNCKFLQQYWTITTSTAFDEFLHCKFIRIVVFKDVLRTLWPPMPCQHSKLGL